MHSKHNKIKTKFYNLLIKQELYKNNYKSIYNCYEFLKLVAHYNHKNSETFSQIHCKIIMNIFQSQKQYKIYLETLVELGLLLIDNFFVPPSVFNDKELGDGQCKSYHITELGCEMLYSGESQILYNLHFDKNTIRTNQKRIYKSKVLKRSYNDELLDYIHETNINMTFDYQKANHYIETSDKSLLQKTQMKSVLNKFKEMNFIKLERSGSNNRIWNEFVGMNSELRSFFKYKDMNLVENFDIRSCAPIFFSSYISSLYNNGGELFELVYKKLINLTKLTKLPHDLVVKGDNSYFLFYKNIQLNNLPDTYGTRENQLKEIRKQLDFEHNKWLKLFENELVDPRDVLISECGFESRDDSKSALIEGLNGSKQHPKFIKWLKFNYPVLFTIWELSNTKQTSNNISKYYETILMQNTALYRMTKKMDIRLTYEYDGMSVFAKSSDFNIRSKIDILIKYIKSECINRFGINLVIKIKMVKPEKDFFTESRIHTFNLKRERLKIKSDIQRKKYLKWNKRKYGSSLFSNEDLKKWRQAKDKDSQYRNELNMCIYDFQAENQDIKNNKSPLK